MVNAQEWLDQNYPKEGICLRKNESTEVIRINNFGKIRSEITELDISQRKLSGHLDLSDFVNLESLYCPDNQLTSLNVSNCKKLRELYFSNNYFTSVDFLNTLSHPEKLASLEIYNNKIQPTDITIFSKFTNLRYLKIGTTSEASVADKHGKYGKFFGSLQAYQNLTKLEAICIEATNVDSGLEYLPLSLAQATKGGSYTYIECSPHNTNAKCSAIQNELRPFNYDLEAWQLAHPEKMLTSHPEYFIQEDTQEQWIVALENKIIQSQQELQKTKTDLPDKVKRIERLESKINLLKIIKNLLDELVIERVHSQDINEWYKRQLDGENAKKRNELWNLILELKWNSKLKDQENKELKQNIETIEKIAEQEYQPKETQNQTTQTELTGEELKKQQKENQELKEKIKILTKNE